MFRERDPQVSLWQSEFLVPPKKARRLERSWAEVFRNNTSKRRLIRWEVLADRSHEDAQARQGHSLPAVPPDG